MEKICVIGDIVVDVSLAKKKSPLKMRLGGIIHCARALWASGVEYSLAYFAPKYLRSRIEIFLKEFGNPELIYLGEVENSPYIMLINEVKEIGDQGYEFLLRDDIKISYNEESFKELEKFSETLIISGSYSLEKVLSLLKLGCKISIDFANNIENLEEIKSKHLYETLFISTSSNYFKNYYNKNDLFDIVVFCNDFKSLTKKIVLKENRGGSRALEFFNGELICIPSQTQPIVHSVGVGDVYNTIFLNQYKKFSFEESLNYASWIATEYALTTFPEDFRKMTERILKSSITDLIALGGVILPWEKRKKINIYIAAPDFDFVDTSLIDLLENNLKYHNFSPRRPIKENGQMEKDASIQEKEELFQNDMILLNQCKILIAVLLYNDPGTLIEIGLAVEKGIPTLVYDPYKIATNCMLTQIPDLLSSNLDEIICKTFEVSQKII